MQKNKFIHEDIWSVCNSAAKKLVALGLIAAVGGNPATCGNVYQFIASAQTKAEEAHRHKQIEDKINDIKQIIERVENTILSRERIQAGLELQLPEFQHAFSAWVELLPNIDLDRVLTDTPENSIERLLSLMPENERISTERMLADVAPNRDYRALWFVLRDIWTMVRQPLYATLEFNFAERLLSAEQYFNDLSTGRLEQNVTCALLGVMTQFDLEPSDFQTITELCFSNIKDPHETAVLFGASGIIDELQNQVVNKFGLSNQQLINLVKNMVHLKN